MYSFVKNLFIESNLANISIQERAVKFSDGFFDTIRINNYQLYQWAFHKTKIDKGLKLFAFDIEVQYIEDIAKQLISKNNFSDGLLRISISRGIGGVGYGISSNSSPTLIIETITLNELEFTPRKIWLSSYRKVPPICMPTFLKSMQGSQSVLARIEADQNDCFESLLLTLDNFVAECSSSNIFWVKNNQIYTPSLTNIYNGSIRDAIIKIFPNQIIQDDFSLDDLEAADEVFITNVSWLVIPVSTILPINKTYNQFNLSKIIYEKLKKDIELQTR